MSGITCDISRVVYLSCQTHAGKQESMKITDFETIEGMEFMSLSKCDRGFKKLVDNDRDYSHAKAWTSYFDMLRALRNDASKKAAEALKTDEEEDSLFSAPAQERHVSVRQMRKQMSCMKTKMPAFVTITMPGFTCTSTQKEVQAMSAKVVPGFDTKAKLMVVMDKAVLAHIIGACRAFKVDAVPSTDTPASASTDIAEDTSTEPSTKKPCLA